MNKHVVIIGKYYPPEFGGVERYTYDISRIAAKGYRVTVVVHNRDINDSVEVNGNITVVRCGTLKIISSQPISPSMFTHLRALQPDLVVFNAPNFWAAAILSAVRFKAPLIVTHHADVFGRRVLKRVVMPIYRHLVRHAACVVVNSLKNVTSSHDLPRGARKFVEIPWAVESKLYELAETERAAVLAKRRERFGSAPVIGFVGRFVRYKAIPILIEAVARLDGVHAVLVGDGPLRAQIEEQIRATGLQDRVHLLGSVDERSKISALAMMDILALPSNDPTEAFGLVQVEGQLMGLPVVASRLQTGITDVTLDEVTGLLVPPDDPTALADAFSRLIKDKQLATAMGARGRERALRFFDMKCFEEGWSKLFRAVLMGLPLDDLMGSNLSIAGRREKPIA
jgi:glycosyltransferase involved in cell wall biosynthesis